MQSRFRAFLKPTNDYASSCAKCTVILRDLADCGFVIMGFIFINQHVKNVCYFYVHVFQITVLKQHMTIFAVPGEPSSPWISIDKREPAPFPFSTGLGSFLSHLRMLLTHLKTSPLTLIGKVRKGEGRSIFLPLQSLWGVSPPHPLEGSTGCIMETKYVILLSGFHHHMKRDHYLG